MEVSFFSFAETQKNFTGTCTVVDVCLDAMEKGMLPVVAEQRGYYLWEYFYLTTDQVARVCALLKRRRLPPCLLWTWGIHMPWTRRYALTKPYYLVTEDPVAIAATLRRQVSEGCLTQIEFLWQDLDAVQAWMKSPVAGCRLDVEVKWVAAEVARRRQWFSGLRRTWLLAVVADSCS